VVLTSLQSRGSAPDEITVEQDRIVFKLTSEQTDGALAVFDIRISPGGGAPLLHRHDPFELYGVRRGELAFYIEENPGAMTRTVAGPGTVVSIECGREHTVRNESDEEAEATIVFSPGEPMERFARACGHAQTDDELVALAAAHGIEITRPIEDALAETGEVDAGGSRAGYLTIARFHGDGDRLLDEYGKYAGVMSEVGRDHGLILHAGAKTDGGFLIVNLWPSKKGSESAARDPRRLDVIEQAEISVDQIHREHHEVAHYEVFDSTARSRLNDRADR
jgi:mannose-6-phosphate isomerase-like protein (cupin superfamily)